MLMRMRREKMNRLNRGDPARPSAGWATRSAIGWAAAGGVSFWLPAAIVSLVLHQAAGLWTLNLAPLAGLALLGAVCWKGLRTEPRWAWALAGVYILGPTFMLLPSVVLHTVPQPDVATRGVWLAVFCIFPPMTIWIAVLNGMIFSVLAATVSLPLLAVRPWGRTPRPGAAPFEARVTSAAFPKLPRRPK